jgi:hypothetical protein
MVGKAWTVVFGKVIHSPAAKQVSLTPSVGQDIFRYMAIYASVPTCVN